MVPLSFGMIVEGIDNNYVEWGKDILSKLPCAAFSEGKILIAPNVVLTTVTREKPTEVYFDKQLGYQFDFQWGQWKNISEQKHCYKVTAVYDYPGYNPFLKYSANLWQNEMYGLRLCILEQPVALDSIPNRLRDLSVITNNNLGVVCSKDTFKNPVSLIDEKISRFELGQVVYRYSEKKSIKGIYTPDDMLPVESVNLKYKSLIHNENDLGAFFFVPQQDQFTLAGLVSRPFSEDAYKGDDIDNQESNRQMRIDKLPGNTNAWMDSVVLHEALGAPMQLLPSLESVLLDDKRIATFASYVKKTWESLKYPADPMKSIFYHQLPEYVNLKNLKIFIPTEAAWSKIPSKIKTALENDVNLCLSFIRGHVTLNDLFLEDDSEQVFKSLANPHASATPMRKTKNVQRQNNISHQFMPEKVIESLKSLNLHIPAFKDDQQCERTLKIVGTIQTSTATIYLIDAPLMHRFIISNIQKSKVNLEPVDYIQIRSCLTEKEAEAIQKNAEKQNKAKIEEQKAAPAKPEKKSCIMM